MKNLKITKKYLYNNKIYNEFVETTDSNTFVLKNNSDAILVKDGTAIERKDITEQQYLMTAAGKIAKCCTLKKDDEQSLVDWLTSLGYMVQGFGTLITDKNGYYHPCIMIVLKDGSYSYFDPLTNKIISDTAGNVVKGYYITYNYTNKNGDKKNAIFCAPKSNCIEDLVTAMIDSGKFRFEK